MTTPIPAPNPEPPASPAADAVLTDYADLGTAFGLDASVASAGRASANPVAPAESATPALPWEHRLTRRSGL